MRQQPVHGARSTFTHTSEIPESRKYGTFNICLLHTDVTCTGLGRSRGLSDNWHMKVARLSVPLRGHTRRVEDSDQRGLCKTGHDTSKQCGRKLETFEPHVAIMLSFTVFVTTFESYGILRGVDWQIVTKVNKNSDMRDRRLASRLEFFRLLGYYAMEGGFKPTFRDYYRFHLQEINR